MNYYCLRKGVRGNHGRGRIKKVMEKAYKLGFEYEKIYGGCAQSTIAAIQDSLGIRDGGVFKTGTGLARGGGLTGIGDCGAYVAGIMVLSQLCGRERSNFEDPGRVMRVKSYNLVKKLIDEFLREFGTIICRRDIQMKKFGRSYYIRDSEDRIKFEEAGAHDDKCTDVVGKGAQMAVKIILDEGLAALT